MSALSFVHVPNPIWGCFVGDCQNPSPGGSMSIEIRRDSSIFGPEIFCKAVSQADGFAEYSIRDVWYDSKETPKHRISYDDLCSRLAQAVYASRRDQISGMRTVHVHAIGIESPGRCHKMTQSVKKVINVAKVDHIRCRQM